MHYLNPRSTWKISTFLVLLLLTAASALMSGCTDNTSKINASSSTTTPTTATSLQISATNDSVPSDNTASTTLTVTALDANNAAMPNITVQLSTDTGLLSTGTVTTDATGMATFTFSSGTASLANRTATITANAGATIQKQILILGSTLSLFSASGSSIPNNGASPVILTFIAKNAQGTPLVGTAYTATWATTDTGMVTLTPTSGVTDTNGKFTISVAGSAVGTATITATAAGSTASATVTISLAAGTFSIDQATVTPTSGSPTVTLSPSEVAMYTSDTMTVEVTDPNSSSTVTFITTSGNWNNVAGQTSLDVAVGNCGANLACATLYSPPAGTASIQVLDKNNTSLNDTMTASVTAKVPYSITLQATPTQVKKSTGSSSLIATVLDATGAPVGNAPVAFSLSNTTGGGESVSPVLAYTAAIAGNNLSLGQASATFSAGSLSSNASGVQVRATVLGTAVATEANLPSPVDATPSGNDAAIVIGGTAGSIAFGTSTKITELNSTTYQYPMSVQVSDVNGNPAPAGTTVTLSLWPIAWSTESIPCTADFTDASGNVSGGGDTATAGTFYNEDTNENLNLDTGEDGKRKYFFGTYADTTGTKDGQITPVNSAAGTLPSTVSTDANGLANFSLIYLKSSAIWTWVRIRASTVVQGTETLSQTIIELPALQSDVSPICYLSSPYRF